MLALAVLPRLRVGGRQLLEHEMPGPGDRDAEHADPRHRAPRLDPLHRAHRGALRDPARARGDRASTSEMSPFQSFAHALTTIPTAGFSTKADSIESFAAGDPVGDRPLHGPRRVQLRAHVPDARAPPAPGARARRARPRLYLALLVRRLRDRRRRDLDRGRLRRRRRLPRRRLHRRLDDDDDRASRSPTTTRGRRSR